MANAGQKISFGVIGFVRRTKGCAQLMLAVPKQRDEVLALCRGKIANYKLPKEVRFLLEHDVPRSTSGKIIRHELENRLVVDP